MAHEKNPKILLAATIFVFIIAATAVCPSYAASFNVKLSPSVIFDTVCAKETGYKINKSWKDELNTRLPALQAHWNKEGSKLLETTEKIIGKPFDIRNYRVALTLCSFPSMSDPLLVNMRYSLKSFTANPLSSAVSVSIIYHEILHPYVASLIPKNSALLRKYSHESPTVKEHLHLLALMKAVYLALGQKKQLDAIIIKDNSLPNPSYKRTWEIINGKEGYRSFINELKTNTTTKSPALILKGIRDE